LILDAPSGPANKIISFKAKVKVILAEVKTLRYKSFADTVGVTLKADDLQEFTIKPVLRTGLVSDRIYTNAGVQVTGKIARLDSWRLVKNRIEWRADDGESAEQHGLPDGVEYNRGFFAHLPKDVGLEINVLVPVESRILEFEMRDIELP
jgi:hypothetical protein